MSTESWKKAVSEFIKVPDYIEACASAIRYDLLNGPCYARVPESDITKFTEDDFATFREDIEGDCGPDDKLEEPYCGLVGDTLKDFIDDLPSELWVDTACDYVSESEPEGYEDEESGEWVEPDWCDYVKLEHREIVEVVFGRTIAREFR